jgi:hypothetical protein
MWNGEMKRARGLRLCKDDDDCDYDDNGNDDDKN